MKVFIFDNNKCVGCWNCQVACKDEHCGNDWTPFAKPQPETGHFWLKLKQKVHGNVPQVRMSHVVEMCQHCDDAPCIKVCPEGAIYKRNDGLVIIDPVKCLGHQMCIEACPYGAIYFNQSLKIAQKCTGCSHLLDRGWPITEPRCVDLCSTEALRFGEEADFSADIAQAEVLEPNFGAKPKVRVYYKNLPKRFIAGTVYDPIADEVVEGATCTLSGDISATAVTDGWGDFWLEGLPVGTFSLTISGSGKTTTIDNISTEKDVGLGDIALT
jgi:Fe-S-cluster-containing dehydrogenase component